MSKYLKAILVNLVFFLISSISFLILTPIAIHLMGDEFFGIWSVLNAIILFSTIGTLGISSIVNKFSAEISPDGPNNSDTSILISGFVIILPMATITMVILLLTRSLISANLSMAPLLEEQFRTALIICSIGIIPQFLSRVPQGFLLSQLRNNVVRTLDFVSTVFPLIGAVLISSFQKNLIWIASWFAIVQSLTLFAYLVTIRQNLKWPFRLDRNLIRKMLGFSFYMFIQSSASSLFQQFDRVVVAFVLGPVITGVYSIGTSVGLRIVQISGNITDTMIPYASLKNSLNEHESLYQTFRKMSQYISFLVAVIAGLSIIWMKEILTVWISQSYAEKFSLFFCVLILAYGFLSLSRSANQTLTGLGQVKLTSITFLVATIIMLIGLFFLSKKYGLYGATLSNTLMILLITMNLRTYKILQHKINWNHVFIDLRMGLLFPLLALMIVLFQPVFYFKLAYTVASIAYMVSFFIKDDYLKRIVKEIGRKMIKSARNEAG